MDQTLPEQQSNVTPQQSVGNLLGSSSPPPKQPDLNLQPKSKNRFPFLIVIFALIVLGVVVTIIYLQRINSPLLNSVGLKNKQLSTVSPVPSPQNKVSTIVSVPAGWKTATNKACNLNYAYPPDWETLPVDIEQQRCFFYVSKKERGSEIAHVSVVGQRTVNLWQKTQLEIEKQELVTQPINIARLEGITYPMPFPDGVKATIIYTGYAFHKGDDVYSLDTLSKDTPDDRSINNQIIATFTVSDMDGALPEGPDPYSRKENANPYTQDDNTKRRSDVSMLLNAVGQYAAENKGILPPRITNSPLEIAKNGVDLCEYLVPDYIPAIPSDPKLGKPIDVDGCKTQYKSGYTISKSSDNRITVSAPNAENNESISVTR